MKELKYTVKLTRQFKKDYKRAQRRGLRMELLQETVAIIARGETLPEHHQDHELTGNWLGHRECHILPDWLLVYRLEDNFLILTLVRNGTHSDIFG